MSDIFLNLLKMNSIFSTQLVRVCENILYILLKEKGLVVDLSTMSALSREMTGVSCSECGDASSRRYSGATVS